ncbi:MAG TPA: hypothetical protein VFI14_08605 [Chryseosolibacter sp.]|nr:hypothetical protein [Chryseosolibacter sp.]
MPDKVVNPNKFEYRLTPESDIKTGTLETVKRFGISNSSYQYERFMVDVDWSGSKGNALSTHYAPEYSTEKLFLRIVLEGEASLYAFIGDNGLELLRIKKLHKPLAQPNNCIYICSQIAA